MAAAAALLGLAVCCARTEPNQVTGLTATQEYGFTTLKWDAVSGATDYQIERTPVDAGDVPAGAATVVGVWQAQRTITPTPNTVVRGVGVRARRPLHLAGAGTPRRDQPTAVLGAGDRHHDGSLGNRPGRCRAAHAV